MANAALEALTAAGINHRVVRHEHVTSLAEAAVPAGVDAADVIKTIVVRRADDDYVLVPGDRAISWPKLRAVLGVNRLSMPQKRPTPSAWIRRPAYAAVGTALPTESLQHATRPDLHVDGLAGVSRRFEPGQVAHRFEGDE
jgi:Aminoacyl-tRNA editing domain